MIFNGTNGTAHVNWNRSSRQKGICFSLLYHQTTSRQTEINLKCLGPDTLTRQMEKRNVSASMSTKHSFALRCGHVVYWYNISEKRWYEPLYVACSAICCVDDDDLKEETHHNVVLVCVNVSNDNVVNLLWISETNDDENNNMMRREDRNVFENHDDIQNDEIQIVAGGGVVVILARRTTASSGWFVRWFDCNGKRSKISCLFSKSSEDDDDHLTLCGVAKPHESIVVSVRKTRWVVFPDSNIWSPEMIEVSSTTTSSTRATVSSKAT